MQLFPADQQPPADRMGSFADHIPFTSAPLASMDLSAESNPFSSGGIIPMSAITGDVLNSFDFQNATAPQNMDWDFDLGAWNGEIEI